MLIDSHEYKTKNGDRMINKSSNWILRSFACLVLGVCTALPISASAQQAFPTKPIRLIVGFAPGGGTDIVARAIAPKMGEVLGQTVIIENKSGAAGTIGADLVAKSNPCLTCEDDQMDITSLLTDELIEVQKLAIRYRSA